MINTSRAQLERKSNIDNDEHLETDHLLSAIGGRTLRGGAVTMVSHALKFSITIGATAVMARLLTPGDYGLIAMLAVVTSFASLFKDLGLSHATVQTPSLTQDQVSTLFWINLGLSLASALFVSMTAPLVAWLYGEPRLTAIAVAASAGFILGGLAVQHEALLKRQMRFFALSAIAFISMLCGYSAGIWFAFHGAGYWALVISQLALLAANATGVWILCAWRPGLPKWNSGLRAILTFGGNVTGHSMITHVSSKVDNVLLGRFWEAEELGLYSKAFQLLGLPTDQVNDPVAVVTIPALSRLNGSPDRYRQAYLRIMEKVLIITMPCTAFMIASADWLVHLILGPQWNATAQIFVFLGIAGLFQPVADTAGWLLITQGRTRHMLHWSLISAPVTILFTLARLPWGAVGVAISFSLGRLCVIYPLMYWFVGRTGPLRTRDFYRLIAPFTCASAVALLACLGFRVLADPASRLAGVLGSLFITGSVSLLVLALIPSGRRALVDIRDSLQDLVAARRLNTQPLRRPIV